MSGNTSGASRIRLMGFDVDTCVTSKSVGRGAVREVCDHLLAAQGRLETMLAAYLT